jgi:ABC-type oligopeptide transport system substrate-binding subunit
MIEAQAVDFNRESRRKRLVELQRYLLDQAYMFSPVTEGTRWAFRPDLKGFHPNASLSEYIHWSRVWLDP